MQKTDCVFQDQGASGFFFSLFYQSLSESSSVLRLRSGSGSVRLTGSGRLGRGKGREGQRRTLEDNASCWTRKLHSGRSNTCIELGSAHGLDRGR